MLSISLTGASRAAILLDPLLAELELVEPSLFLRQSGDALERLVQGIAARAD